MNNGHFRSYDIDSKNRKALIKKIKTFFKDNKIISFAYIHGSFVKNSPFKDIDIAIYIEELSFDKLKSPLKFELNLETLLEEYLSESGFKIPVDIRILNYAPLSFQYSVIRDGLPLIVRHIKKKDDFELLTLVKYFDFAPFRKEYMKEVLKIED